MSNKTRVCVLCNQHERNQRWKLIRIFTVERAEKILEGYRRRHNGEEFDQPILNRLVHQKCYNEMVEGVSTVNESMNIFNSVDMENDGNGEEQDEISVIRIRSRMPLPSYAQRRLIERRRRACAVCHRYSYSSHNKLKQIVSNYMASKLAAGFHAKYGRPYGQSLLDAYMHQTCYKNLYTYYRYHVRNKSENQNRSRHQVQFVQQSLNPIAETQSYSSPNGSVIELEQSSSDITNDKMSTFSTESLSSTRYHRSMATINPKIELSALSSRFRPCIQRLTPAEIEFYTKQNPTSKVIEEDNMSNTSIAETSMTNNGTIYSNLDDHDYEINMNEEHQPARYLPLSHPMLNNPPKICGPAHIRRRYSKPPPPPLAKPTNPLISDHIYKTNIHPPKASAEMEVLYEWIMEQFDSLGNPISMGDVSKKYMEFTDDENNTSRESFRRERLRHLLEKFYPNRFVFVTPNRREGTFIALNNIDHYIRLAIKNAKAEKEKATEAAILSSVVVPSVPVDLKRQTCEEIMNGVRKLRLYIRDPEQIHSLPPLLIRNTIGLITSSERQFEKLSHQYDFYRMIDEDLFENNENNKVSNRSDKNLRHMSLASDLISARHDNRVSQKHFLLADELTKKDFHCTPKQVITLLNRYGHTCSYKSYIKMKILRQQAISELGEELERIMANEQISSDS